MQPLRLGLIGAGNRGRHLISKVYVVRDRQYRFSREDHWSAIGEDAYHGYAGDIPSWAEDLSDVTPTITAVFDPAKEARSKINDLCSDYGDAPRLYQSFDTFLKNCQSYDAVIIASPNHKHVNQVQELLERKIDVFCEKPIATTIAGHEQLIEADDQSDALLYVGFNLRSHPVYARMKELQDAEAIGQLGMLTAHNIRVPLPTGFRYNEADSGGTLLEKNCHDFDLFNWYTERDPLKVAAFGGQQVLTENTDILDHATVIVEYENGVKATLELCLYAPFTHRHHRSYFLRGTEGILQTTQEPDTVELFTRTTHDQFQTNAHSSDKHASSHGGADIRTITNFLRCLQEDETPPATPRDAKKAAVIAIGAQRSIKDGTIYEIDSQYDLLKT